MSESNPISEMGTATNPREPWMAVRPKAVLKHTQSKRWREVWCGHVNAELLDCVRFIARARTSQYRDKEVSIHVM